MGEPKADRVKDTVVDEHKDWAALADEGCVKVAKGDDESENVVLPRRVPLTVWLKKEVNVCGALEGDAMIIVGVAVSDGLSGKDGDTESVIDGGGEEDVEPDMPSLGVSEARTEGVPISVKLIWSVGSTEEVAMDESVIGAVPVTCIEGDPVNDTGILSECWGERDVDGERDALGVRRTLTLKVGEAVSLTLALVTVGNRGEGEFVSVSLTAGLPLILDVPNTELESMGEADVPIDDEAHNDTLAVEEKGRVALMELVSESDDEAELETNGVVLLITVGLKRGVEVTH